MLVLVVATAWALLPQEQPQTKQVLPVKLEFQLLGLLTLIHDELVVCLSPLLACQFAVLQNQLLNKLKPRTHIFDGWLL
jgi:hypothetical protein